MCYVLSLYYVYRIINLLSGNLVSILISPVPASQLSVCTGDESLALGSQMGHESTFGDSLPGSCSSALKNLGSRVEV